MAAVMAYNLIEGRMGESVNGLGSGWISGVIDRWMDWWANG